MAVHTPRFVRVPIAFMFFGLLVDLTANTVIVAAGARRQLLITATA